MRPKVKFLTVVWGETYIARFATLALPSFLAPGNLPALAEATDLEIVIMTRHDDIDYFENHVTFRRLQAICPVRFIDIDDLVTTSVYGVTLTLAYARPIIACGAEMLDTHFVFMNADFVLADGSLRSLCKHISDGRSIVLGPSFRATAEAIEPILEQMVDASGVLTVPTRELAALSLAHPHPTTVAKIINQGFFHSTQPNQFFWQVDDHTLLGRYYLIFMLCLKPEKVISTVNCYCDYSFIPELCPSGDEAVMNDSDEFFMLELQHRNQEMQMLRLGKIPDAAIAGSLQYWTTTEHRRAAGHDIVFHGADIPPEIEAAKHEARDFIGRIGSLLGRPLPHTGHKFWIHGVEAWRYHRLKQGQSSWPPELAKDHGTLRDWLSVTYLRGRLLKVYVALYYAKRRAIEEWLPMTPFHPRWLDFRLLQDTVAKVMSVPGAHLLVIRDRVGVVDRLVSARGQALFATPEEILGGNVPRPKSEAAGYANVLIYLERKDCRSVQRLIEKCRIMVRPDCTFQVIIDHPGGDAGSGNFSDELMDYVDEIIGWPPKEAVNSAFVGGSLKRLNTKIMRRLSYKYAHSPFGKLSLLWLLPLAVVGATVTLITNLYLGLRMPRQQFVSHCSSLSIRFSSNAALIRSRGLEHSA